MKRAAVICCGGIGDSLLMMIAAYHLEKAGYCVTVFGNSVEYIAPLFKGYTFVSQLPLLGLEERLAPFDQVIVQNDHSARAYRLFDLRDQKKGALPITFFFPTFCPRGCKKRDVLFDRSLPMATNIARACYALFKTGEASKDNGLIKPAGKIERLLSRRIVLHPTSSLASRSWNRNSYLKLAYSLKQRGFAVAFAVSPKERSEWLFVEKEEIALPFFSTFCELAAYFYESGFFIGNDSGLGHLASNLGLPTLTLSGNLKWVQLWRPGWCLGEIVTPPFPLPNFRGIGWEFRERHWSSFVPVSRVLRSFSHLEKRVNATAH